MAKTPLCQSMHKVEADPAKGVKAQWVRCIRNEGHPTGKGAHTGAIKKEDGTVEIEVWS